MRPFAPIALTGRLAAVLLGTALGLVNESALAEKPRPTATTAAATPAPAQGATEKPAAGSTKTDASSTNSVVGTEESKEGVKTYKFGAVEVEGRLRSPQLTYFLRRVRAEFSAGDLGHRSFMRELAETTRYPAFR
ncbi:MAG TPA: hypothetical protein VHC69_12980 [Polyangiaceae bacterium]|nr:hypothetical protein [Polyangiaceae bacterium]